RKRRVWPRRTISKLDQYAPTRDDTMKQTNWREVAKERWIKIADQHQEIERLRAALKAIADDPDTNIEAAVYAKNTLAALTAAQRQKPRFHTRIFRYRFRLLATSNV